MRVSDPHLESCDGSFAQTGADETVGGREGGLPPLLLLPSSLSHPPSLSSHSAPSLWPRPCPPEHGGRLAKVVKSQPEHVIGAHPRVVNVLQDETLVEAHDGVFIRFKLSYDHTQDAAVWSRLVVLRCYTMRYFCEGETSEFLNYRPFPLELLTFPCKA